MLKAAACRWSSEVQGIVITKFGNVYLICEYILLISMKRGWRCRSIGASRSKVLDCYFNQDTRIKPIIWLILWNILCCFKFSKGNRSVKIKNLLIELCLLNVKHIFLCTWYILESKKHKSDELLQARVIQLPLYNNMYYFLAEFICAFPKGIKLINFINLY